LCYRKRKEKTKNDSGKERRKWKRKIKKKREWKCKKVEKS
jgi:hypothetical protein